MAASRNFEEGLWTVEREIELFSAMRHYKPVGVNRYFNMLMLADRLKPLKTDQIWAHLNTMYDLNALNLSECNPFPNKELDFCLPDTDYSALIEQNYPRVFQTPSEQDDARSSDSRSDRSRSSQKEREPRSEKRSHRDRSSERSKSGATHSKDGKSPRVDSRDHSERSDSKDRSESRDSRSGSRSSGSSRKRTRQSDAHERKDDPVPVKRSRQSRF